MSVPNDTETKVYVAGLPWITTTEGLRSYFEQFGEIVHANVVCDRGTKRSKGFGFVTFREAESAKRACEDPNPIIDGRKSSCRLAYLGDRVHNIQSNQNGLAFNEGPNCCRLASDGENENYNGLIITGSLYDDLCYLSPTFIQQQLANLNQPPYLEPHYWDQHYQQFLPLWQYYALYNPKLQYHAVSQASTSRSLPPTLRSSLE